MARGSSQRLAGKAIDDRRKIRVLALMKDESVRRCEGNQNSSTRAIRCEQNQKTPSSDPTKREKERDARAVAWLLCAVERVVGVTSADHDE
jgi:hypothetical protein